MSTERLFSTRLVNEQSIFTIERRVEPILVAEKAFLAEVTKPNISKTIIAKGSEFPIKRVSVAQFDRVPKTLLSLKTIGGPIVATLGLAACVSTGSSFLAEFGVGAAIGLISWGIFRYSLGGLFGEGKLVKFGGLALGAATALFPGAMAIPLIFATLGSVTRVVNSINNKPMIKEIEARQGEIKELFDQARSGSLQREYGKLEELKKRLR